MTYEITVVKYISLVFIMGGSVYYWLKTGPTKLAIDHYIAERKGSER